MHFVTINNRKYSASTLIFIISFFFYTFAAIYAQTEYERLFNATLINLIQWVAILLIVVKIIFDDKINSKNLFIWVCFLLLNLLIAVKTKNYRIVIPLAAFMLAASNIDEKIVIKTSFVAMVVMILLTVGGSLIGVIPSTSFVQSNGERVRYALGFAYTTYLANFFFHSFLMWLFLKRRCPTFLESVIVLLINFLIYYFTNTRAVFFETIVLILFCWIFKKMRHIDKSKLRYVFLTAFIWCALLAICLHIFYDPNKGWMLSLNRLLSSRLQLGRKAYGMYGFSIFGQQIEWSSFNSTVDYLYVDSSYLNLALNYGVVWLFVLIAGFTALMNKYIKSNKTYCCIALLFLALHSITDPQLYSFISNPFIFLLGAFFPLSPTKKAASINLNPTVKKKALC